MINLSKISRNNHALFLAYDQGFEHGPTDFDDESVDPENVLKIAASGFFTGVIFQKGIVEKYCVPAVETLHATSLHEKNVALIVKLNGKTHLANDEPMAEQICSVDEAIALGAAAIGYTIYLGSEFEEKMLKEFSAIEREAHSSGVPVIAWMYPRGSAVQNSDNVETIAYAARVGLEIGADVVKVRIPQTFASTSSAKNMENNFKGNDFNFLQKLKWIVKSAGRCRVVFAGGSKLPENEFLETASLCMQAGAFGMAVGRNIWQNKNPLAISQKLAEIIFKI